MTRTQKINKLERAYKLNRLNHKPTSVVWKKLNACVTRDLLETARVVRRSRRAHG